MMALRCSLVSLAFFALPPRLHLEREHAAYEYVKQHGEQVTSLHVAMNSMVKSDADFFLETRIA
jgi:hypothetical protein